MKTNFVLKCLAASSALLTVNASPLQIRQENCPEGEVYYVCGNGYKGCFSSDVCSLPATSNDASRIGNQGSATVPNAQDRTQAACDAESKQVVMPDMHNIYMYPDQTPYPSKAKILNIYKREGDGVVEQQQVAVFKGIPSTAKRCAISAKIAAERSFSVYDHGLMNVKQLTKVPQGDITVDSIKDLDSERPANQFNFQFWPETPGPRLLNTITVDCAAELIFRFSMADEIAPGEGGHGAITLEQDADNGFFLEYSC